MRLAAALAAILCLPQDDKGESFYVFKPGTTWTYRQKAEGAETKIVISVLKHEAGKVHVESKEFKKEDETPHVTALVWHVADGFLVWDEVKEGETETAVHLLKIGSKKGDTWTAGKGDMFKDGTATHEGTSEVTVPAGTYKEAMRIKIAMKDGASGQWWVVPKVGLVKMQMVIEIGGEKMTNTLELAEFKEGK